MFRGSGCMTLYFGVFFFVFVAVHARAQEFWLQPNKIRYKTGDTLKVSFQKGVNFNGRRLTVPKEKIERLELRDVSGSQDLLPNIVEVTKFTVAVPLQSEGTKIVVAQTTGDINHYNANDFEVFLKENGLDDVMLKRKETGATSAVTEIPIVYEKLLIQVGNTRDDTFKENCDLPLEIIPDKNPLALKRGDVIHFKVLFQGKPLFGAKVRIWNYYDYLTTTQNIFTQQDGTIEMTISSVGSWLINVVKMVPLKDGGVEWQGYRSSLMFGIK